MRATSNRRRQNAIARSATTGRGCAVVAPPPVTDGKVRCPVCRNTTVLTARGYLRRHRDLFGHDCHNVAP